MYVRIENNIVAKYPIMDIRSEFPNSSLPEIVSQSDLPDGYFVVAESIPPAYGPTSKLVEADPILVSGKWVQQWSVVQLGGEELAAAITDAEQQARTTRNTLLSTSDWTQGKDIPNTVSSAWAVYRQLLRDVPQQDGFPFSIIWPNTPTR